MGSIALPDTEYPWPVRNSVLPVCVSHADGFHEPTLAAPMGQIKFDLGAPMLARGRVQRVGLRVIDPETGQTDHLVSGDFDVETSPGLVIVSTASLAGGRGEVSVVAEEVGDQHLSVVWDADASVAGRVEVRAYESQLPIWELNVAPDDLARIVDSPDETITIDGNLIIQGQPYATALRIHGGSSRYYPKKSFRFDLTNGLSLPTGQDHLILRAEWNDKTMLRNHLAFDLIYRSSHIPAVRTEAVHFRINERYYGVMWHVERVDGDFLRARALDPAASLYEASPASQFWEPGGGLYPLVDHAAYEGTYEHKKGDHGYDDLIELIEGTVAASDDEFAQRVADEVKLDEILVYLALMAALQSKDHIKKNYYLYRDDDTVEDRWRILPWDLDLTFGHLWTEEDQVLDETIFLQHQPRAGHEDMGWAPHNLLFTRLWRDPGVDARFSEHLRVILERFFVEGVVGPVVDNALCLMMPDLLADTRKRASNEEYLERVEELFGFMAGRSAFLN